MVECMELLNVVVTKYCSCFLYDSLVVIPNGWYQMCKACFNELAFHQRTSSLWTRTINQLWDSGVHKLPPVLFVVGVKLQSFYHDCHVTSCDCHCPSTLSCHCCVM